MEAHNTGSTASTWSPTPKAAFTARPTAPRSCCRMSALPGHAATAPPPPRSTSCSRAISSPPSTACARMRSGTSTPAPASSSTSSQPGWQLSAASARQRRHSRRALSGRSSRRLLVRILAAPTEHICARRLHRSPRLRLRRLRDGKARCARRAIPAAPQHHRAPHARVRLSPSGSPESRHSKQRSS